MGDYGPLPAVERIDLAEEAEFELGGMTVKPAELAVVANGKHRELQPRVMQVLVALAKARPGVLSRDRLVELCWDGRIVGDDALNRCILALRHLAQEFTPSPFAIETVPRVGHRLVERQDEESPPAKVSASAKPWRLIAAVAALLIAIATGILVWQQGGKAAEPASIAVLPFRNLSAGDPYFAEGIGEEILGQLAREPQFRVAGRASSEALGKDPNIREVGEKLNVDYALTGSVRTQGERVRVSANLVRARDNTQLWSNSYDGKLDDIFAIQREIGGEIANALRRKLLRAPAVSGPLTTNGQAYNLYLTARGLLKTRHRQMGPTAAALLRDAINMDPNYAPAWSSLAEATSLAGALGDKESLVVALGQARRYAAHAVKLAPDLAEAHRALGQTYGYGSPKNLAHLKRAFELDPRGSENLQLFGDAIGATGEFDRQLDLFRQSYEVDPLWFRTVGSQGIALADMGKRKEAEAIARKGFRSSSTNGHILLARIAWIMGDFSEAYRHWQLVVASRSPRWSERAGFSMKDATYTVGLNTGRLVEVPDPIWARRVWRIWRDKPPTPQSWQATNRDELHSEVYRTENLVNAKLMLNGGRGAEIVASYRSKNGFLGIKPGVPIRLHQIDVAPILWLALREAGDQAEAARIAGEAEAAVRKVQGRGAVPFWFDSETAAVLAAAGRTDEALSALERAFRRGWTHSNAADLRDINDEPAFRSLHGNPRFRRLQAQLAAHYARERRELQPLLRS